MEKMILTRSISRWLFVLAVCVFSLQGVVKVFEIELDLSKLSGTWQNTKSPNTYEKWEASEEAILVGKGYKVAGGKEALLEELRILKAGGNWYYEATVSHNPAPVRFKLTSQEENKWVFENPEHDFPQKIVYEWLSDTELKAYVSAGQKGFEINFKKVE